MSDDTMMLSKMIYEIPAFLYFLTQRRLSTECVSRMWFSFESYHTKALDRIIAGNRSRLEQQIAYVLLDIMENYNLEAIDICPKDIYSILMYKGCAGRYDLEERNIKKVLQYSWELTPVGNGFTYTKYVPNGTQMGEYTPVKAVGRYYTIKYDLIKNIWHEFSEIE